MYASNGSGPLAALLPQQTAQPQAGQPVAQPQVAPAQQAVAAVPAPAPAAPTTAHSLPATIAEIEAACPGASADFVLGQVKSQATLQHAQTAYTAFLAQRIGQLEAAATQPQAPTVAPAPVAQPQAAAPQLVPVQTAPVMPGNQPVVPESGDHQGQHDWKSLVEEESRFLIMSQMEPSQVPLQACINVDKKYPGLRDQLIQNWRPQPGRQQ